MNRKGQEIYSTGRALAQGVFRLDSLFDRLNSAFPYDLFLAGQPFRRPRQVVLDHFPTQSTTIEAFAARTGRGISVDVILPQSDLLPCEITLPPTTRAKAEAAIALKLRQQLPGRAQGLVWRITSRRQGAEGVSYRIVCAKEAQLLELQRQLIRYGLRPRTIRLEDARLEPFFQQGAGTKATQLWRSAAIGVVGAALLCTVALPTLRASYVQAEVDRLRQEVNQLQTSAVTARATIDSARASQTQLQSLLSRFNLERRRLDLLASMTEILPDHTWVSELTLTGDKLYASLFSSADVSDVLSLLQSQAWSKNMQLDGPILQDPMTRQSRFQIVAEIVDDRTQK